MATATQRNAADLRREQIREQLWPGSSREIFDRNKHDGYSTVPRIVSMILGLIEELADKGKNSSRVYCELWFRAFHDKLIEVQGEPQKSATHCLSLALVCAALTRRKPEVRRR